jgi:hypothetical protein
MNQRKQLMKMLPAKQQTLDFGVPSIWQKLSAPQRRACQAAIADLIYQVAQAKQKDTEHINEGNDNDE